MEDKINEFLGKHESFVLEFKKAQDSLNKLIADLNTLQAQLEDVKSSIEQAQKIQSAKKDAEELEKAITSAEPLPEDTRKERHRKADTLSSLLRDKKISAGQFFTLIKKLQETPYLQSNP